MVSIFYSIVGAVVVIFGLYLLLWGKEGDQPVQSKSEDQFDSSCDEQKDNIRHIAGSVETKVTPGEP